MSRPRAGPSRPRPDWSLIAFYGAVTLGWILVLTWIISMVSCATVEAAVEAPEGYWSYTWRLVEAALEDVWCFVKFLLPI